MSSNGGHLFKIMNLKTRKCIKKKKILNLVSFKCTDDEKIIVFGGKSSSNINFYDL